jgi:hypothetical protein
MENLTKAIEQLSFDQEYQIYIKKISKDKRAKILFNSVDKNKNPKVKSPKEWVENQYHERYFFKLTGEVWPKNDYYFYYNYMYEKTKDEFSVKILNL